MKENANIFKRLTSCVKEHRMPYRLRKAVNYIKQQPYAIPVANFLRRFSSEKDILNIEISDCNLKCAMCARSSAISLRNHKKEMMDLELFKKIIDKVVSEKFTFRNLFFGNFGEPLLNPSFPDMVSYAKSRLPETTVGTFANLNYLKDPKAVVSSGLDRMWVSISGMTQDVYSKNHLGGHIDAILSNFNKIIYYKKELNSGLKLRLRFHDYLYNKKDAILAKRFCDDNDIEFELLWCFIPGVEANMQFHQNKEELTKFYSQFIDMEKEEKLMNKIDYRKCNYLNNTVYINYDGRLYRCGNTYEEQYLLGSFFNYKIREIPYIKSKICKICSNIPISGRLNGN